MDTISRNVPFAFVYADDILIYSRDLHEHIQHIREVFTQLAAHDLTINPDKCQFATDCV